MNTYHTPQSMARKRWQNTSREYRQAIARKGGLARAKRLSKRQRSDIGRMGAVERMRRRLFEVKTVALACGSIYASLGEWRVLHWPQQGGAEAYRRVQMVNGPKWVLDGNDEMPAEMFNVLLAACKRLAEARVSE